MKHIPVRLGPLALLLTVVAICMTVLGLLTFSTARADLAMAQKLAASTQQRYELEAEGQAFLQEAAEAVVPVGKEFVTKVTGGVSYKIYGFTQEALSALGMEKDENGVYWKELSHDSQTLRIGLDFADAADHEGKGFTVVCWQFSREWQAPEEIGGLWAGE